MRTTNRWVIATTGVFLQIAFGAVYAWSVFRIPLAKQFEWSISEPGAIAERALSKCGKQACDIELTQLTQWEDRAATRFRDFLARAIRSLSGVRPSLALAQRSGELRCP